MEPKNPISGVILCGGKSTRMGFNKAFTQIKGIPIINRIYEIFTELFQEIIIVANERNFFRDFDANVYEDLIPNKGALGGLYTGIFYASFLHCFCVACDMPFIQKPLVNYLVGNLQDYDVVVPRTSDGLQPLHALYSKSCLPPIRKLVDKRNYKIIDFYKMVRVRIVEEDEFVSIDPLKRSFINVNTPEELLSLEKDHSVYIK